MRKRTRQAFAVAFLTLAASPVLSQGRRAEDAPWIVTPTADSLLHCSPAGTETPRGRAVAMCKVGPRGALEDCSFDRVVGGAPMRRWAACAVSQFVAKSELRGRLVEVPVEPTDEVTQILVEPSQDP